MSRMAMHIQHYKGGAVGAIDRHNKRLGDSHGNELIVPERSGDNIAVLRPDGDLLDIVREIASHAKGRVTKNSVLVSEWVIYPPEELQDPTKANAERLRSWGQDVVRWLHDKGLHPVSATIHRDETTNHMHIDTIPLTKDGRLCRKELYTRDTLKQFHSELSAHLKARGWNVERGQSTEGKEVRSLNVREYKQEQEALRLAHEAQLSETKKNLSESSQELQETLVSLETALGEKIALENKIKALWKPLESSESVDELLTRTKKTITGKAVRKQDDDRALIEKARRASFFEQRLDKEKQTSSNLSRVVSKKDSEISELKKENKELKDLCSQLTEERDMQRDFIKTYGLTDRFSVFVAEKQAQARELAQKAVKKISNRFSR